MDSPPQVPPPIPPFTPPRFTLPLGAWIAWGIFAAINIAWFFLRKSPTDPYQTGELFGRIVAAFILPSVIALIAWRVSGRSTSAGKVTFFVVFGLAVLGQLSQFMRKAEANAAMNKLEAESQQVRAEQRASMAQGRPLDDSKAVKIAEKASANFAAQAENSTGNDRITAEAGKAFMDEVLAVKKRYDRAIANLDPVNFWKLAKFAPGAPAEARRAAVREFTGSSLQMKALYDAEGTGLRRQLESRGASAATIRDAIAGYKHAAGPRLALLEKVRNCEAQNGQVMLEFIDFAETNREQWHVDPANGKIIFNNQDLLDHYNELIKRSNTISAEQTEYQKQVLSANPSG